MRLALIMELLQQKLMIINLKLQLLEKIYQQMEDMLKLSFLMIGLRTLQEEILPSMQFMQI